MEQAMSIELKEVAHGTHTVWLECTGDRRAGERRTTECHPGARSGAPVVAQALFTGWWMLPVLITLAPFYGGLLLFLCNNTQHVGLQDEVEDFRLCTRTIYLNPLVQFLYWHMNYHIEHHMYAGVPCYKLARLHGAINHELPYTANGLYETWSIIIAILNRQKQEPRYQFVPELPAHAGV